MVQSHILGELVVKNSQFLAQILLILGWRKNWKGLTIQLSIWDTLERLNFVSISQKLARCLNLQILFWNLLILTEYLLRTRSVLIRISKFCKLILSLPTSVSRLWSFKWNLKFSHWDLFKFVTYFHMWSLLLNELTFFLVDDLRFARHSRPISNRSYILGTLILTGLLVLKKLLCMFLFIGGLKPIWKVFVGEAMVVIRRINLGWFLKLQRKLIWKHFLNVWTLAVFRLGIRGRIALS